MFLGIPSLTALIVASARRAAALPSSRGKDVLRLASAGLVDHLGLRTGAIDAVVTGAVGASAQVVILGAGLDRRAWRLASLGGATVFEVDHPATQRLKQRLGGGGPKAARLVFVGVDFERDALGRALEASGQDASHPTIWVWEGVTMYLTREAARATLADVAARSAPGSILAVTYGVPSMAARGVGPVLDLIGEPLRNLMVPRDAAALVGEAGFVPVADTGPRDWAAEAGVKPPRLRVSERLIVARFGGAGVDQNSPKRS